MKMLSLFSGIGAFEKALKNLDIPFELVGYCEIDKYASKSYSAIHDVPESMNLGDITKIDERALPKDIDLITYGFPCQDISLAGKQKGLFNEDGTQTRSGLFFEALRIIEETKPKIAIAENVKNLVGKKFNAQFQVVLASLEAAGYNNYWQVLNAKDYGIPQNRERVFIVSIRKDIDTGSFKFPEPFPLELRLKNMLEDEVDEKFYLSQKAIDGFNRHKERHATRGNGFGWQPTDGSGVAFTLQTSGGSRPNDNFIDMHGLLEIQNQVEPVRDEVRIKTVGNYSPSGHDASRIVDINGLAPTVKENHGTVTAIAEPTIKQMGQLYGTEKEPNPQAGRIYDAEGISPTLDTCSGGNRQPKVVVSMREPFIVASRGRNPDNPSNRTPGVPTEQRLEPNCQGICNTLTTVQKDNYLAEPITDGLRIRKLTPKECFRLMGFSDEDFAKAEAVNSNTQLYKQAGNSIVVDVIVHIFKRLKLSLKPEYLDGDPNYPICPNCRTPLREMEDCDCGQKIDWSEE